MNQDVVSALKQTELYSDGIDYAVIKLPAQAITAAAGIVAEIGEAFCALIVDKDEVSLILPSEAVEDFAGRLKGHTLASDRYRLITFDLVLDFNLFGFMAVVSDTLAGAKVSILPIAAFSRDHILVPSRQFDIAIQALKKLQSSL
ncbi:MAG: ACT domain-containing protein [Anaerolineaceae bacterium]|nr:ACT domain-containing protein [Anaerolineaceae bacterium]